MWDILKKAAGVVLERGADYLVQATAVQTILNSADFDSGVAALRDHIYGLESEASFNTFLVVVQNRHQEALQAVEQARHDEAGSWGNTVEDRMARSMAHLRAGIPQGQSAAVQQAEQFVETMVLMDKYARQFWHEAEAMRAQNQTNEEPEEPEGGPAPAGEQRAGFAKYLADFNADASNKPAIDVPETGPLTDMQALSLQMHADSRTTRLMIATMPGQATEEVVTGLEETYAMYARVLRDMPDDATLTNRDYVMAGMARAQEFAGNACDSLRQEARALPYYEKALNYLEMLGDTTNAEKLRQKISVLKENMSGDIDGAVERLSSPRSDFLDEMNRLLDLAGVQQQGGDRHKALELLHKVEAALDDEGIAPPSGDAMANDLMQSMAGLMSGEVVAGNTAVERTVKIRAVFQSLYSMLARVYGTPDPDHPDASADMDKADAYHKKWEALDNPADNTAFSDTMRRFLDEGKLG
ncbi:MAG: hypothetical protein AAFP85_09595 [Pseudomonadota bacterium]